MGSLNTDLLDANTRTLLSRAADVMRSRAMPLMMPEHALFAILRMPESTANRALQRLSQTRGFKLTDLENELDTQLKTRVGRSANFTFTTDQNSPVSLSDEMLIAIDEARSIALAAGEIYIATEDLLGALAQPGVSTAGMLQKRGITPAAIGALVNEGIVSKRNTISDWVQQAKRGQLAPLYMRDALLRDLVSLLSLAQDRNVILIGAAGSGRRSLAQSLAMLIAENKGPREVNSIVEVSDVAWLDNPTTAIQIALKQASGGALFVPNIHRFFSREPKLDAAAKELQKAIVADVLTPIIIGTCTEAEYNERIRNNAMIESHVHVLRVPPATNDECTKMLTISKPLFVRDYNLTISDGAIKTATTLAGRYIGDMPLPGSAATVLHRACAIAKSADNAQTNPPRSAIDNDDVTLAISMMTGIPASKLGADERSKFAQMTQTLQQRVIGQDDAVLSLSRAVKSARVGLKDPKRPIGSFLFLGPSGVGKTELARALAEFLFGSEDAMVAIDMSEYQKDDTINRLIGAPPGYVGYEGGGQLTERILKSPYAVVLFDEVEKAHPRILDILLQVMEEGRLTDGQGRVANFSETVIILTSNLGAIYLNDPSLGARSRDLAMSDVRAFFRPEFLNRLDDIVMFSPLSQDSLRKILDLMIVKEAKLAKERGIGLEVTPAARDWLMSQNTEIGMGARPLRRILQRNVRDKLADYLLTLDAPPSKVVVDADAGALKFGVG